MDASFVRKGCSRCPPAFALVRHILLTRTLEALCRRLRLGDGFLVVILVGVAFQVALFMSWKLPWASLVISVFTKQPGHLSLSLVVRVVLCWPFPWFSIIVVIAIALGGNDCRCSRLVPCLVPSSSPG